MNKFLVLLIFYILSGALLYLLDIFFPPRGKDGGWSLAALASVLLSIVIVIWFAISLVKGFTTDKSYLLIALIHLIVVAVVAKMIYV